MRYSLDEAPMGSRLDPITGDFSYRPTAPHGALSVTVRAFDPRGAFVLRTFALSTQPDTTPLVVTVSITPRRVGIGQPGGGALTYSYDAAGNQTGLSYPNGINETRTYDDLNRVESIEASGPFDVVTSFRYKYTRRDGAKEGRVMRDNPTRFGDRWVLRLLLSVVGSPAALGSLGIARDGAACTGGSLPVSPEDLVRESDVIVRVKAIQVVPGVVLRESGEYDLGHLVRLSSIAGADPYVKHAYSRPWAAIRHILGRDRDDYRLVEFETRELVKGSTVSARLHAVALPSSCCFGRISKAVPYTTPRRSAQLGCFAFDYRIGAEYLFILQGGVLYHRIGAPLNEEVRGPDDPWLNWVKKQVRQSIEVPPNSDSAAPQIQAVPL